MFYPIISYIFQLSLNTEEKVKQWDIAAQGLGRHEAFNCGNVISKLELFLEFPVQGANCRAVKKLPSDDFSAHVWGAKQEANTPVHHWLVVEYALWYLEDAKGRSQWWGAGWAYRLLQNLGSVWFPSVLTLFLTFRCLLGPIYFLSFPEHAATFPWACWCAWDAAHCRQFQLIKLHQARLLPGYLGVVFFLT